MYIKSGRRLLSLRAAAAAVAVVCAVTLFFPAATRADDLASLQRQYDTLQQQQKSLQQQLNQQSSKLTTEKQKQATLNAQVNVTVQQISVLNAQISALNAQIGAKTQEIADTQQKEQDNLALYKQRMRAMYEMGETSFIEVLLSSKDLSDFLSRAEMLRSISVYDNNLINSLKQSEEKLKADQAALTEAQKGVQNSKAQMTSKQEALNDQLAQEAAMISQMTQDKAAMDAQNKALDAQINAVVAAQAAERARQLALSHGNVSDNDIVNYAKTLIGKPYRFGTFGPKTYDCSGFTMVVYANVAGITLTHSALDQSTKGRAVATSDLQPGDLVFFATEGGRTVTHVGIYVGGGAFIGANTSTGIAIVNNFLSDSYWGSRYVSARRLL